MNNEIDIQFEQTKTDLLAKIKLGMKRNKELFFSLLQRQTKSRTLIPNLYSDLPEHISVIYLFFF